MQTSEEASRWHSVLPSPQFAACYFRVRGSYITCEIDALRYPLLYFPVKITEIVWKSSAFKNCWVLLKWAVLMHKRQSHWPVLTYYHPCFDFSESIRANADNLINIHEPSSSIILSAFYMVINSRIFGSFVILSVLFVVFSSFFYRNTK